MAVRMITVDTFHAELMAQDVPAREHLTFVCPMCKTPQSAQDLIEAGAGETFDDVEPFVAFACVGRWTGAGSPRNKPDCKPCNWTLGGLFKTHSLEVITPDGVHHPRFELATPEEARAHLIRWQEKPLEVTR